MPTFTGMEEERREPSGQIQVEHSERSDSQIDAVESKFLCM